MSKTPTNSLNTSVVNFLKFKGHMADRMNAGGIHKEAIDAATGKKKRYWIKLGPKGIGDIVGILQPWGIHIEVETKYEDVQTEDQVKRMKEIRARGGIYILCHNIDEFMKLYEEAIFDIGRRLKDPPKRSVRP